MTVVSQVVVIVVVGCIVVFAIAIACSVSVMSSSVFVVVIIRKLVSVIFREISDLGDLDLSGSTLPSSPSPSGLGVLSLLPS